MTSDALSRGSTVFGFEKKLRYACQNVTCSNCACELYTKVSCILFVSLYQERTAYQATDRFVSDMWYSSLVMEGAS